MGVTASAPAKVILFGEHFVVYGEPAIVLAIDKRATAEVEIRNNKRLHIHSANLNPSGYFENKGIEVEQGPQKDVNLRFDPLKLAVEKVFEISGKNVGLDIKVTSRVPVAAGLGSSAALAAAATAATGATLNVRIPKEDVFRISYEAEKIVHGNSSGVDATISTFGGTLLFQADTGFKPLNAKTEIPLVIGHTGVKRSTRVQVEKVSSMMNKYPRVIEPMMRSAREIVLGAIDALKEENLEILGNSMNINHALLCGLGVSHESLERLINAAKKAGALGAKMTGAGGGGCMIALAKNGRLGQIFEAIQRAGGRPFIARKTDEGVKIEEA